MLPSKYFEYWIDNAVQHDPNASKLAAQYQGYLTPTSFPAYPRIFVPPEYPDEEPIYVNAKQYNRILKRRQSRAKWMGDHGVAGGANGYRYSSRHMHAKKRPRDPAGRFIKGAIPPGTTEGGDQEQQQEQQEHPEPESGTVSNHETSAMGDTTSSHPNINDDAGSDLSDGLSDSQSEMSACPEDPSGDSDHNQISNGSNVSM